MMTRFAPPFFRSVFSAICLTLLVGTSAVFAADYVGPVFPDDDMEYAEPLPLPRRNPLLQRPQSKQVVFDDLDPVGSVIPSSLLYDEEDGTPQPVVRQRQTPNRIAPVIDTDNVIFTDAGEVLQDSIFGEYPYEMGGYVTGPIPVAFGMGLFDNIQLFSEVTTFKTGLSGREGGYFGMSEGLNWSAAVTPQGSVTAQYGIRAVQGDFTAHRPQSQVFMTAGLFKRFNCLPVQGGVAIDWLEDRSQWRPINMRQMRCELSGTFNGLEAGFLGGFDVFWDHPRVRRWNSLMVHDYYLLFFRKHLPNGGQVELRCGSTAYGDFIMSALSEVAISDRVAVNGGISVLAPSGGQDIPTNLRESWSLSLGVVLYFRGGATFRQMNSHRPMFDVAGNNSFFTRMFEDW